jgi:PST family polysaccharide transporter
MNLNRADGPPPPLSQRAMNAATWRFGASAVSGVLSFGIHVWLARLLPPSDFGLVAMAFLFTGLARIVSNLGLPAAIVQRSDFTENHVRTAFTLSTLLGLAVTVTIVVFAPYSTLVFPEPRLPAILRALAPVFLFTGLGNTAGALLRRTLDFRRIFWVSVVGYLIGFAGVAVPLAMMGYGVWSLVFGAVGESIVEAVLLLAAVRHPMRPLIGRRETRDLTGYAAGISLGDMLRYGARSGDNLVIGRWLGDGPLGLYTKAYGLMRMPAQYIGEVFNAVLFPAFSELQNEKSRLAEAYLRSTELAILLSAPILAGMAVAAPHLVVGLLGPNWEESVRPLQILSLVGVLSTAMPLSSSVANAVGRVYAVSLRTGLFAVALVGLGYLATPGGINAVAGAVTGAHVIAYILMAGLALDSLDISWKRFLGVHRAGFIMAMEVGAASVLFRWLLERQELPSLVILPLLIAVCAITFWLGMRLLPQSLSLSPLMRVIRTSLPEFPALVEQILDSLFAVNGGSDQGTSRESTRRSNNE